MCRLEGISYDIENKTGTTFLLLNTLQTGVLGVLTIGKSFYIGKFNIYRSKSKGGSKRYE